MIRFKPTKIICSLALASALLFLPRSVGAKVTALISKGSDDTYYQYDYDLLLDSYVSILLGDTSPVFDDYKKRPVSLMFDDVNGYIDYDAILDEYMDALLAGKSFDLNAYTSGPKAEIVFVTKVNEVTVEDGKIVYTEKLIADPVEVAMDEVNSAQDAFGLRSVLEKRSNILGLDMEEYNQLFDYGKTKAVAGVLENRGDGFADPESLLAVFEQEVQKVLDELDQGLDVLNSAADLEEFTQLLLDGGEDLGLELHAYEMILSTRRAPVMAELYEAVPFQSVSQLIEAYNSAVGTALRSYVVVAFTNYDYTLLSMVDKQMKVNPQWWDGKWTSAPRAEVEKYVNPKTFLMDGLVDGVSEIIIAATVRVREEPTTESAQVDGSLTAKKGEIYSVEDVVEVTEGTSISSLGYWFKITVGEKTGWVSGNFADWVADDYSSTMFQFLALSGESGVTVSDLGSALNGKGILHGMENVFFQAARDNNVNEAFLVALALHETGNGTSQLANGVLYTPEDSSLEPRVVYNMFGIGARDSSPLLLGSKYAYEHGWFTPELAIIGGAQFHSGSYINNTKYYQNTLYKMRWNPGSPATHQYATDIGWASKQTYYIRQLYEKINIYNLRFNVPRYMSE